MTDARGLCGGAGHMGAGPYQTCRRGSQRPPEEWGQKQIIKVQQVQEAQTGAVAGEEGTGATDALGCHKARVRTE